MWQIWLDLQTELRIREPFNAITVLSDDPACAPLFQAVPMASIPANMPPAILQQVYNQILQQVGLVSVPPAPYATINAVVESRRLASRFVIEGRVFGTRTPDLQLRINAVQERSGWTPVTLPTAAPTP